MSNTQSNNVVQGIRVPNTYDDIEVTEASGRADGNRYQVSGYLDVTWSVDRDTRDLYIYDRSGKRVVHYNASGWIKVRVVQDD